MNSKITYHKEGNYYLPNLYLEKENYKNDYQIEKYGHLRLQYLKDTDPLKWTELMNNYKYSAEEIIFKELIYI